MKNIKSILFGFLWSWISFSTHAQSTVDKTIDAVTKTAEAVDATMGELGTSLRTSDTTYIKFYDEVSFHLYSVLYFNNFTLNDLSKKTTLKYKPAISPAIGFGFSRYGFTLNISNDFKIVKQSETKYGKTKKFNLRTSFIYKKMWLAAFFSNYKGYYIDNYKDFNLNTNGNKHPQREDIETTGFGLSYMHVFNSKKFSLNAAYTLTQKQLKSAGSFLVGVAVNGYFIDGDSSLVPTKVETQFSPYLQANNINQYLYGVNTGYSHNFVFLKHFNLNLTAVLGYITSTTSITTINADYNTRNNFDFSVSLKAMGALSYVRDRFYIGSNIKIDRFSANTGNQTEINSFFVRAQFFAGYRIKGSKNRKKIIPTPN